MRFFSFFFALLGLCAVTMAQEVTSDEAARLREIEAQREENARRAAELRERTETAAAEVETQRSQLVEVASSLRDAEMRLTQVEESLVRLDEEEAAATANLQARQESLSEVLAALLFLERSRPPALAVSPDDANKAAIAAITLSSVTPELEAEAASLKEDIERIDRLRTRRAAEREELREAESALDERRLVLEELLTEWEVARDEDAALLADLESQDEQLAREATNLRELIAGIAARDRQAPEALPDLLPGGPEDYANLPNLFTNAQAQLTMPAVGRLVYSYGDRNLDGVREDGLAIATRAGAVVTAPFGGVVDWADEFGRLGNIIILDVGEDYRIVLMGIGRLDVRSGQQVRAGEPVGAMQPGAQGLLKFQVRRRDLPVDPIPWLMPRIVASFDQS